MEQSKETSLKTNSDINMGPNSSFRTGDTTSIGTKIDSSVHHHHYAKPLQLNHEEANFSQVQKQLRNHYRKKAVISRLFYPNHPLPIADSYINLAIIEQKEQQEKNEALKTGDKTMRDMCLSSYEYIHAVKKPIVLQDIFQNNKTRLFIQGRAGVGKTTLCQHIAYMWAAGKLWKDKFDWLFWIPLRNINGQRYLTGRDYNRVHVLNNEIFSLAGCKLNEGKQQQLGREIEHNSQKILWLLDGFDELPLEQNPHIQLLWEELSGASTVIITSRPNRPFNVSMDEQLEVTGFTDENINNYIEVFFNSLPTPQPNSIEPMKRFLHDNHGVKGSAHIPINLELICSIWSMNPIETKEPLTVTVLYENLLTGLLNRCYYKKEQDEGYLPQEFLFERYRAELEALSYLAHFGMKENTIIFTINDIYHACKSVSKDFKTLRAQIMGIGLLKKIDEQSYCFLHLTFQEFLAAFHLANQWRKHYQDDNTERAGLNKFIAEEKYNPRLQVMWWFVAGLVADKQNHDILTSFFQQLQCLPRDILGVYEMGLWVRCLDEGELQIEQELCNELLHQLRCWLDYFMTQVNVYEQGLSLLALLKLSNRIKLHLCNDYLQDKINQCITNPDFTSAEYKLEAFRMIEEAQCNVPAMIDCIVTALRDGVTEDVRYAAAVVLGKLGVSDERVIAALIGALKDENKDVRNAAAMALGEGVSAALIGALKDEDGYVRARAAEALGMGVSEEQVIAALIGVLKDEDGYVRAHAVEALGKLGVSDERVIAALIGALKDEDGYVRAYAVGALDKLGVSDEPVIAALIVALKDEDKGVRNAAAMALGEVGVSDERVIAALIGALKDEDGYVRVHAVEALGRLGVSEEQVIAVLIGALKDEAGDVRVHAVEALGRLGVSEEQVIAVLIGVLKDEDGYVRVCAAKVLGKLGVSDEQVIAALIGALNDNRLEKDDDFENQVGKLLCKLSLIRMLPLLNDYSKTISEKVVTVLQLLLKNSTTAFIYNEKHELYFHANNQLQTWQIPPDQRVNFLELWGSAIKGLGIPTPETAITGSAELLKLPNTETTSLATNTSSFFSAPIVDVDDQLTIEPASLDVSQSQISIPVADTGSLISNLGFTSLLLGGAALSVAICVYFWYSSQQEEDEESQLDIMPIKLDC